MNNTNIKTATRFKLLLMSSHANQQLVLRGRNQENIRD